MNIIGCAKIRLTGIDIDFLLKTKTTHMTNTDNYISNCDPSHKKKSNNAAKDYKLYVILILNF